MEIQIATNGTEINPNEAYVYSLIDQLVGLKKKLDHHLKQEHGGNTDDVASKVLQAVEFEKDDDKNFHISFIKSAANLRARNYNIAEADFHQVKKLAGKIIPAIATTTAMITGLVCLEFYKLMQQYLPLKKASVTSSPSATSSPSQIAPQNWKDAQVAISPFKNFFVNLGISYFGCSQPLESTKKKSLPKPAASSTSSPATETKKPAVVSYPPEGVSIWDEILIDEGDLTFFEFVVFVRKNFKFKINAIFFDNFLLFDSSNPQAANTLKDKKISQVLAEVSKKEVPKSQSWIVIALDLSIISKDEEKQKNTLVLFPLVKYKFRK
eukprot:TRINITY_DN4508_c0_g2_i1.p1 TRINITY_DN4508_c0_g2~~TRINITY_DN4508_c0_g2_i1.p1  ORF type:complete len:355 (+),score=117.98 TRINITY_DN4508_c0_g2_i1:94-1065(+)